MEMRRSLVLDKLRAGQTVTATKINLADTRVIEAAALAGFDCLWTDLEHVPNDNSVIEKQVLAGKAHGKDVLVRVARGGYSSYIHPLEMDAAGIMVPHVKSLEDAKKIVETTRFHPIGRRAVDGGNADSGYCRMDFNEYLQQANRRRFVVVQIEDPEPLEELDAICALDGIDIIFFGPGDFSHSIGDPGNFANPRLLEAREQVAKTALRHGKFAGTVCGRDNMAQWWQMGYRFLCIGADVVGLMEYYDGLLDAFWGHNWNKEAGK